MLPRRPARRRSNGHSETRNKRRRGNKRCNDKRARTPFNVGFSFSPLFVPALNCFCRRNLECVAVCRSSSYCELTAPLDNAQGLGDDYGSMAWKTYRECQNFGLVLASKGNRVKWRLVIRAGGASKFVTNTDCRILLSLII